VTRRSDDVDNVDKEIGLVLLVLALSLLFIGLFAAKMVLLGPAFVFGLLWIIVKTRPARRTLD